MRTDRPTDGTTETSATRRETRTQLNPAGFMFIKMVKSNDGLLISFWVGVGVDTKWGLGSGLVNIRNSVGSTAAAQM